jgi:hypothetical protein
MSPHWGVKYGATGLVRGVPHISIPLNLKVEATKSERRNADCCRYQTVGTVTHEEAILRELNAMIANKTIKFGKSP